MVYCAWSSPPISSMAFSSGTVLYCVQVQPAGGFARDRERIRSERIHPGFYKPRREREQIHVLLHLPLDLGRLRHSVRRRNRKCARRTDLRWRRWVRLRAERRSGGAQTQSSKSSHSRVVPVAAPRRVCFRCRYPALPPSPRECAAGPSGRSASSETPRAIAS